MKKAGAKKPAEIIRKYGKSLLTEQNRTEYN